MKVSANKVVSLTYELKIEDVEIKQCEFIVFKHKEKVPVKQYFALYAINKIATIANNN